ncbi:MAG: hypothetical protein ABI742_06870 [Gemmatimonadota bacterium]
MTLSPERFSQRRGFTTREAEITIRDDAPAGLRDAILQIAIELGWTPKGLRSIVCRVLRVMPDDNNWSDYPNVWHEVGSLLHACDWYHVYDVIEALYADQNEGMYPRSEPFEAEINAYFKENGIGWQLVHGTIEVRGPEAFEAAVHQARQALGAAKLPTAQSEIHEALLDLSRRPHPDLTGALHHSMAAVECAMRAATGDANATLGDLLKRNPGRVPKPLDLALEKLWGFASDQGRHLREGGDLNRDDVELLVGIAASVATFIGRRLR